MQAMLERIAPADYLEELQDEEVRARLQSGALAELKTEYQATRRQKTDHRFR